MTDIIITYQHCSYWAIIGLKYLKLFYSKIYFYNENTVINCHLSQGVGFTMRADCEFHIRKSVDYTRGEVFAVKAHSGKVNEYCLYIPAKAVGLRVVGSYQQVSQTGLMADIYTKWSIKATDFEIHNQYEPIFKASDNNQRVIFKTYNGTELTEKGKTVDKMRVVIGKICNVGIENTVLANIMDKFEIKYKGPTDRLNNPIYKGAKVKWYDPEEESRDLERTWEVDDIKTDTNSNIFDDTIILISDEYSEAEVFPWELEVITK